ncbi:hypothetical protein [Microbacterium sp. HJ5]
MTSNEPHPEREAASAGVPEGHDVEATQLSARRGGAGAVPDETIPSARRIAAASVPVAAEAPLEGEAPLDATVVSSRRRPTDPEPDDGTVISSRRRQAAPDDGTVISSRRRAAEPAPASDDVTELAVRRHPAVAMPDDATAVSARRRSTAEPEPVEVLASRPGMAGVDTVPEHEDTLLRPGAPSATPAAPLEADPTAVRVRDARIPDAAALRTPQAPRPVPTVTAVRAPAPTRPAEPGGSAAPVDHESLERAVRVEGRRRVLLVVVSAAVVALASAGALVMLLT